MAVQVYGCNHIVIEVTDAKKAVKFYSDVFGLKMLRGGEGAAWCKLGEHQFMAIFEVDKLQPDRVKHFGLMVRDAQQIKEVRRKLTKKYKMTTAAEFPVRFPRSLGQPYSGRRSQRRITCLAPSLSGSAESRNHIHQPHHR